MKVRTKKDLRALLYKKIEKSRRKARKKFANLRSWERKQKFLAFEVLDENEALTDKSLVPRDVFDSIMSRKDVQKLTRNYSAPFTPGKTTCGNVIKFFKLS